MIPQAKVIVQRSIDEEPGIIPNSLIPEMRSLPRIFLSEESVKISTCWLDLPYVFGRFSLPFIFLLK